MADQVVLYSGSIVSRADAKRRGEKRFFLGTPCPSGHVCERFVTGKCVECDRIYREGNREKRRDALRLWKGKNKEKIRQYRSPEGDRKRKIRRNELRAGRPRSSKCEACGNKGKVVYDHCHKSGAFRGWICHGCNIAIGFSADSPKRLRMMARYLERSSNGTVKGVPTEQASFFELCPPL